MGDSRALDHRALNPQWMTDGGNFCKVRLLDQSRQTPRTALRHALNKCFNRVQESATRALSIDHGVA